MCRSVSPLKKKKEGKENSTRCAELVTKFTYTTQGTGSKIVIQGALMLSCGARSGLYWPCVEY